MSDLGAVGENALLTKRTSVGQASPWDNNGAELGLLTRRTSLDQAPAWSNFGGFLGLITKRSFGPPPEPPEPPPPESLHLNCIKAFTIVIAASEPAPDPEPDPTPVQLGCVKDFEITVFETDDVTPDIFTPTISYWFGGIDLPAGNYRITYLAGAWRPGPLPLWQLNGGGTVPRPPAPPAPATQHRGYFVVHNDGIAFTRFPGTEDEFLSQAAVEAANGGAFIDIVHTGGTIGIYLSDTPYADNSSGTPDPTFRINGI